jgi:hypothetical protein
MTFCPKHPLIDAHFTGTISPEDERNMREHLPECRACRERYERRLILADLDPESVTSEVRIGRGLGLVGRPSSSRGLGRGMRRRAAALASVLALAAAFFFIVRRIPTDSSTERHDGFAPRGSPTPPAGTSAGAHVDRPLRDRPLRIFRMSGPSGQGEPVMDSLRPDDELAFGYENPLGSPYLMIFAVDEGGRVYWYYPAWLDANENPTAVPIEKGSGVHELGEAIRHPFTGTHVEIHGLFLSAPASVRDVERSLAARPRPSGALTFDGGVDTVITFEIRR